MVVAPGQEAGPARRAERGRVHVRIEQASRREAIQVRRSNRRAITPELTEAGVVQDDKQDVRGARRGAQRPRPRGLRLLEGSALNARKPGSRRVFFE